MAEVSTPVEDKEAIAAAMRSSIQEVEDKLGPKTSLATIAENPESFQILWDGLGKTLLICPGRVRAKFLNDLRTMLAISLRLGKSR